MVKINFYTDNPLCSPVEAPVVAERSTCLGCPREIDVESEDLKDPLTYSITRFNADSDSSHHFILNSVGFATRQVHVNQLQISLGVIKHYKV